MRIRSTDEFVRSVTRMESGGKIRSRIEIVRRSLLRVEEVALLFHDESLLMRLGGLGHLGVEGTPAGGGFVPSERLRLRSEGRTNRLRCVKRRRSGSSERSLASQGSINASSTDCDDNEEKMQKGRRGAHLVRIPCPSGCIER